MNKYTLFIMLLFQLLSNSVIAGGNSGGQTPTALACSTSPSASGKAVINEIKTNNKGDGGFIEIYLLDTADILGWAIYANDTLEFTLGTGDCDINIGGGLDNTSTGATATTWPAGTFIVCEAGLSIVPADDEVLLVDKTTALSSGDETVIDYLGYGNGSNFHPKWSVPSFCGTLITDHDATNSDIARIPDGTGALVDNNDDTSKGGPNIGAPIINEAADFNCMEPTLAGTSPTVRQVYTKLSGIDFTLDIVAIKNDGTIDTNYNQEVTVEIIDQNNANAILNTQQLTFINGTDDGKKSVTFNVANAYKNLACRVTRAQGANPIVVISDNFAVRPLNFVISSTLDNTLTHIAGDIFDITATTTTTNYTGTPVIDNSLITAHIGAIQTGSLDGVFPAAISGISSGSSFTYSEVGHFKVDIGGVVDSSYTAIDQYADCIQDSASNTAVNGLYGCDITNSAASHDIGRFIPDHFAISSPTQGAFANACDAGGFTYTGQEFTYETAPSFTLTAYNAEEPAVITQNYTGDFNKLIDPAFANLTNFIIEDPIEDKNQIGVDNVNEVLLSWLQNTPPTLDDNADGTFVYTLGDDDYMYTHDGNSLIGPFIPEVELNFIAIIDSDGVEAKQNDPLVALSAATPYILTPTESELRFGRLAMDNAYGSELEDLAVPVYAEYYSGSDFVLNTDDSCTAMTTADLLYNGSVTNPVSVGSGASTASIENSPLVAGDAGLSFTAPGESGDINLSLSGSFDTTFPWLLFDWDGDGIHDNTPAATATFGLYNGGEKQIFFREVY